MFDFFKNMFDDFLGKDDKEENENEEKDLDNFSTGEPEEPNSFNYQDFLDEGGGEYENLYDRFDAERPNMDENPDIDFVVEFNNLDDLNNYLEGTPESVLRVYAGWDEENEVGYYEVYRYDS